MSKHEVLRLSMAGGSTAAEGSLQPPRSWKQLAALEGEMDGLSCKLSGYERALQDCELQLAERDLQVVLLKSFIKNLDSPTDLQVNFQEVLEHNTHLQQQLHQLSQAQQHAPAPDATTMQVSLLRAALAEANYRLTAAGLMPVGATGMQDGRRSQDASLMSSLTASTPIIKRSFSRLFRDKYSASSVSIPTTVCPSTIKPPNNSTTTSIGRTITASGSAGSRGSPCAPALCLEPKLSEAVTPAEGPDTPQGLQGKPPPLRPVSASTLSEGTSSCTTLAPGPAAAPTAPATAAELTSAVASGLRAAFSRLAAVETDPQAAGAGTVPAAAASSSAGQRAERSCSGFEYVDPYDHITGEFSDADAEDSNNSTTSSPQAPAQTPAQATSAPASPSMCLLGSPNKALTPPCSPCSSISCDSVGKVKLYAMPARLPHGLVGWPGVTCSCDNPLFAEDADGNDRWSL